MAELQQITRHDGPLYEIGAGEYAVDGTALTARCVFVSCPGCAGIEEIAEDHGIDEDGVVFPAFTCEHPLCKWSGLLALQAWAP